MSQFISHVDESLVKLNPVPCKLCGKDDFSLLFSADNIRRQTKLEFKVVECKTCGFRYINPAPTQETLKFYYEGYEAHVPEKISFLGKIYYDFFRRPHNAKAPGKMLDIGCGNGKYISYMKSKGWDAVGLDKDSGCEFPQQELGYEIMDGELWDQNIPDNTFDLITVWWVIEHVWDPVKLMNECRRILKPGGEIIVSTINSSSVEAQLFKSNWWHLLLPEHISQFDSKSLSYLIERTGFKKLKLRHDLITCGFAGGLQNYCDSKKIKFPANNIIFKILFLPVEMICALIRRSGLITIYAEK